MSKVAVAVSVEFAARASDAESTNKVVWRVVSFILCGIVYDFRFAYSK